MIKQTVKNTNLIGLWLRVSYVRVPVFVVVKCLFIFNVFCCFIIFTNLKTLDGETDVLLINAKLFFKLTSSKL